MKKRRIPGWSEITGELKRRKVYPVIAAYAVVAWILLQIGEVTFEPLGLPGWAMTVMIVLAILGFPVVFILSWIFDITPAGLRRDIRESDAGEESDERPSIAVLPFTDMSPAQDQGYFCEGVAEEILNALTKIRQLHVAARSSSFQYREGIGDARRIGKELGVKAILEGSVRKSEDRLRVSAQLVNVADGYHLWSESFDEELKDVFAIQDEIAKSIAEALLETITPKQQSDLITTSSRDVTAYDYYLRGRQFFNRFRKIDIEFAQQMFRHAIDIDPEFALAWAGYADCHSFLIMYADPEESYRVIADTASSRALELDPGLAEAHASRGLAYLVSEHYELAEAQFNEALRLNPRLFEAYYYYARARFHQGDMETAADLFKKAAETNPADYQSRSLRTQILRGAGRREEAVAQAKEAIAVLEKHLEWNPDDARALHLGAGSLVVLGERERAERWLQRALQIDPDDSVVLYNVACNYATLGKAEKALDYLEHAVENGTVSPTWMRNDEDLVLLREHPRYRAILARLEADEQSAGDAA